MSKFDRTFLSSIKSYCPPFLLGFLASGFIGIPIGVAARLFTKKYWIVWVGGSLILSPLLQISLRNIGIDGRLGRSPILFVADTLVESASQCYPKNDDEFFKKIKDTSFLEKFITDNKWKESCKNNPNFSMLEATLFAQKGDIDTALLYLQRLRKEYPDDSVIRASFGLYSMVKLMQEGEVQEAYDGLMALSKDFPNDPNILMLIEKLKEKGYK